MLSNILYMYSILRIIRYFCRINNNYTIMKNFLFLLAILPIMVLSSCSSDDSDGELKSVVSSGRWFITNDTGYDKLDAVDKEANWLSIDHKRGTVDFFMRPYLGGVMTVWNTPFRVEGNSIYIETEYYTHKIVFSDVKSNTARAVVYYDNKNIFGIYLRKEK